MQVLKNEHAMASTFTPFHFLQCIQRWLAVGAGLIFLLAPTLESAAQDYTAQKISRVLQRQLVEHPDEWHAVYVILEDHLDLAALDRALENQRANPGARARATIDLLQETAAHTQPVLLRWLASRSDVEGSSIKNYWVANAIFAKMKASAIEALSHRTDVRWIGVNGPLQMTRVEETPPPPAYFPNGREPGLAVIGAPAMWAKGYTGYGRVAFTNDTGVDPTHPAIAGKFAGLYRSPETAWFQLDPETLKPALQYDPYDCGSHGTHVTGTILGLDREFSDTIGVAFNALWVGAPVLCGIGTEDNVAAFQWALDPDGDPATTHDIPDVINNSWYDPNLDTLDCYSIYVPIVEAMEVAGLAVVFSAGNEGPEPMTITPPHNINLNEVNSFTVGAVNGNQPSLPIANFSSRGPSHCGGDSSLLIKPEVSAPGVSVRSCVPFNGYAFFSGTSMAAPHTSGAILLLKEAFPQLTGKELKLALYHTARDLGDTGEDNTYGMGVIDVAAAFDYLVEQGHVPVEPQVSKDLLLIRAKVPSWACEYNLSVSCLVENAGTDTLHTFDIHGTVAGVERMETWHGILAPGERLEIPIDFVGLPAGTYWLDLWVGNPDGIEDERPLNNRYRQQVRIIGRKSLQAHADGNFAVCMGSSAVLRAEPPDFVKAGEGTFSVRWYSQPEGGNPKGFGQVFVTPPITEPKTWYAQGRYTRRVGEPDTTGKTPLPFSQTNAGLEFDVVHPLTLESVTIFCQEPGGRLLLLQDAKGNNVAQKIVFAQAGANVLKLGWKVQPGTGYHLLLAGGNPLLANTTGAAFPYSIEDVIDITGNTLEQPNLYLYFYDWKVSFDELCERTPVSVDVLPPLGQNLAVAFEMSSSTLTLPLDATVYFQNKTPDVVGTFLWNFGDGQTSTEENPAHTYTQSGTYVVSLHVYPLDGCPAFAIDTIVVTESPILEALEKDSTDRPLVWVYPNPAAGQCRVWIELPSWADVQLHLFDTNGRAWYSATQGAYRSLIHLPVEGLAPGLYFLQLQTPWGVTTSRLVIAPH